MLRLLSTKMLTVLVINVICQSKVIIISTYIRRFAGDEPSISLYIHAVRTASASILSGRVIGLVVKPFEKRHIFTPEK